jgi:excisionase family DNA binding protein
MTTTELHPPTEDATHDRALLDFPGAQTYLGGVSRSTLKLLVWRGFLKPTRIGRRVLFSRRALDRYIERQTDGFEGRVDCA